MTRFLVLLLLAYLVYLGAQTLMRRLRGAVGGGAFRPNPPPPRFTVTVHRDGVEEQRRSEADQGPQGQQGQQGQP